MFLRTKWILQFIVDLDSSWDESISLTEAPVDSFNATLTDVAVKILILYALSKQDFHFLNKYLILILLL